MNSEKRKKKRAGKSLNLVLWFSFTLFALIVVVVYAVLQNVFMAEHVNEKNKERLRGAGRSIAEEIVKTPTSANVLKKIFDIAGDYGVAFYLLYDDGACVWPELWTESSYPEIALSLGEQLAGREEAVFTYNGQLSYGAAVSLDGRDCYLMLESSALMRETYFQGFFVMSIVTGLLSVVLAFAASGFVAMFITKPVTEVTEQAKELARGRYDLNFRGDYFCSEIRDLAAALEYARSEISKTDTVQKELIANVSHDFKTPLTMIKAYASMIREISGEDKRKRDAHAQVIIDECDRLTALVVDVLDLSRLRAGIYDDTDTVFNLSEVVYSIAGRFDELKQTEGYVVETQIEEDIYTYACRERIEQVLYNLIGNAVNYTGEDKRVRVRLFKKEGGARFEVIDSGKGIPKEEIDTVWDRYYRSAASHKRSVSGTGLGLSIVKGILLAQGCPFGIISETGKGSCFWAEFPDPERQGEKQDKEGERVES